ncbi:MAG: DUF1003 domain-containing protein [Steroidobacteraceae bacterium]
MDTDIRKLAEQLLRTGVDDLTQRERHVLTRIAQRLQVAENVNRVFDEQLSFGQRVADRISAFGGSWPFIILFGVVLVVWIGVNSALGARAFDQYPFILLNLVLSMLAAIQAPVIMMSQNRQASKDRLAAGHDYEVNLKAELEIMRLHDKLDEMRQQHLAKLLEQQEEQLRLITRLARDRQS